MLYSDKLPQFNPNKQEKWDQGQGALTIETKEQLGTDLKEATIRLTQGSITVEGGDVQVAQITTRMVISATTEAEAKKLALDRSNDMAIKKGLGSVTCESSYQDGVAGVGGNVFVGNIISTGEVWIDGVRMTPNRNGVVGPSVQREVVLTVPRTNSLKYTLETRAGSVEVSDTKGECRVSTHSADVEVRQFEGELSMDGHSGDVEIERITGEIEINATSGDVEIDEFDGSVNLAVTSGDIKLKRATFVGKANSIRATSGDVSVGVANPSLSLRAETSSGKIKTPSDRDFVITTDERSKKKSGGVTIITSGSNTISIGGGSGGRNFIEGHFGNEDRPEAKVNIKATSGDVTISRA